MKSLDQKFYDSTMSYFVNQLDAFDKTMHMPLINYTWNRDIKLRTDVSLTTQSTSFTRSDFGAVGSQNATGKPWLSQKSNSLPGVIINGERVVTPMNYLGNELSYTSIELQTSQAVGTPLDTQQMTALTMMYNQWTDEMVYVGDADKQAEGLVNSSQVTASNVPNGASASPLWTQKTPDEIVQDVNNLLLATWNASGQALCPDTLLLPPAQWALITSTKVSTSADKSILTYLQENTICNTLNNRPLKIFSAKYLTGQGVGATDRMLAYTNDEVRVRFPLVPMQRQTAYYLGISFNAPYVWAYGQVEFVYSVTLQYADGI